MRGHFVAGLSGKKLPVEVVGNVPRTYKEPGINVLKMLFTEILGLRK